MIYFNHIGDFSKATKYLEDIKKVAKLELLNKYGQAGVAALSSATPVETGKTASSWSYVIVEKDGADVIEFHNSNIVSGVQLLSFCNMATAQELAVMCREEII